MDVALVTDVVGVVRSLGDVGIRSIVVSEYSRSPAFWSRHCIRKVVVPSLGEEAEKALGVLLRLGETLQDRPVVMTGRESDVLLVSRQRERLSKFFRVKMAPPELVETFCNKWKFAELAARHGIPSPKTFLPKSENELKTIAREISFPLLLKPFSQDLWLRDEIYAIVGRWKKAHVVHNFPELERLHREFSKVHREFMVQEFIPGTDDHLFDLHAYCPVPGKVAGYFLGRKIRTHPPYFGQGSYTRSWHDPAVARIGLEALEKTGYVGPANLNLKCDPRTGKVYILEINPRFSLWTHLGSRCGVNLPHAMYNDCLGLPLPTLEQNSVERRWLYFYIDWRALPDYRYLKEWTFLTWLRSFFFPRIVFFRWDWADPLPLLGAFWQFLALRVELRARPFRAWLRSLS